mmetsp:Transcript_45440/g.81752  ORF Transcript_45440/g.81752 Transcript_45440/m.81752 type:complete len:1846 (+) Transcript_45440:80-5617(+)
MEYATPYDLAGSTCSREATTIRFMYFSPEEIESVSVHKIDDPVAFDQLGVPMDGGLYAKGLGPVRDFGRLCGMTCATCGLDRDCPGHMGHIDLANSIYNPFLLTQLLKLMRQTCQVCHKFKAHEAVTAELVRKLNSLSPDELLVKEERTVNKSDKSAFEMDIQKDAGDETWRWYDNQGTKADATPFKDSMKSRGEKEHLAAAKKLQLSLAEAKALKDEDGRPVKKAKNNTDGPEVSACIESLREVLSQYVNDLPAACARCKAQAKWRKEGHETLFVKMKKGDQEKMCLPQYVRDMLEQLWKNEAPVLRWLVPSAKDLGPKVFFLERVLVPPNRFRPPKKSDLGDGKLGLDRQSTQLKGILMANREVARSLGEEPEIKDKKYNTPKKALHQAIVDLQSAVNSMMDSMKSGKHAKLAENGIRQLLEKKEGLFRMKMMGKRVNFAARSVISPDPNIEPAEIGIPKAIASNLTYPEVATPHNAHLLRKLVSRGSSYPGALEVHQPRPDGSKQIIQLDKCSRAERETLSKSLISDVSSGKPPWTVFRQLLDGDPLLVNRQPTLHKPGIMAHTAKVLNKEHTIRLHYVNCNTYNADFDGDEMNLHAPQDPISRMEALAIARADEQYLVPTSGKPLRGLIQDHVIAGSFLTKRDSYYSQEEVCLLLYQGMRHSLEGNLEKAFLLKQLDKTSGFENRPWHKPDVRKHTQRMRLELDPPAVLKPRKLWTGKQVLSMLLKHLIKICNQEKNRALDDGINLDGKSKTPGDIWNGVLDGDKEEATVIFRGTDLLSGVLDKAQFGASAGGITHMCFELMGGRLVSLWLASIARLFSTLLQMRGFTCAYEDLVLRPEIDHNRTGLIKGARMAAKEVAEQWLHKHGLGEKLPSSPTPEQISTVAKGLLQQKLPVEMLEGMIIGKMKESWSGMINKCIPIGQKIPVPRNNFASMVQTGAKGSTVNQSQVSCCLGQQELEGRLPPLMATQRSLPCFAVNDLSNRTRGYIADRFLTGIRPQEFFFHCMAGREGLVDTAVKTSRSGYLQRCLVKHLEGLKISYDHTVRDTDGSVLQFLYGEDGADVTRSTYLFKFDELRSNFHFLKEQAKESLHKMREAGGTVADTTSAAAYLQAQKFAKAGDFESAIEEVAGLVETAKEKKDKALKLSLKQLKQRLEAAAEAEAKTGDHLFDPLSSVLGPAHHFGSTSERHEEALQAYLAKAQKAKLITEKKAQAFSNAMRLKFMKTLAQPGEAVGVLAAQSMGEPSTQMTLNTFHLAGHGGANVTLGIPRLREIIQTASRSCSTPLMIVPMLGAGADGKPMSNQQQIAAAQSLKRKFRKVTLMDCLARMAVNESVRLMDGKAVWSYHCRLEFMPLEELQKAVPHVTKTRLQEWMKNAVCRKLKTELSKLIKESKESAKVTVKHRSRAAVTGSGQVDGRVDEEKEKDEEGVPAKGSKKKRKVDGAEEKAEAEEKLDEAIEQELEKGGEEASDAESGMYSDREEENDMADVDEAELAGAEEKKGEIPEDEDDEEDEEDAAAKKSEQKKDDSDDEDDEEEEEEDGGTGATGGTGDDSDEEMADGGSGGKPGKRKAVKAKLPEPPAKDGRKKKRKSAAMDEIRSQAEQNFQQAYDSGQLVWSTELENNEMTLVVIHRYNQCPHSLFVGEVLHGICKTAELQDPACAGVNAVHVKTDKEIALECEGINLFGLQALPPDMVDHSKIYTNDIRKILETFGVEAARNSVVREVKNVFGHYGIEVDHRHLSLIADYMAQAGGLRAFNRLGMIHSPSPLLQMSYETTMQFLSTACQEDLMDNMTSPASSIVLGQPPTVGTGMVNLLVDLESQLGKVNKKSDAGDRNLFKDKV